MEVHLRSAWLMPMMTAAPDINPEMTVCEMKLVIQPRLKMPTRVYMMPAMNATCRAKGYIQINMGFENLLGHAQYLLDGIASPKPFMA